MLDAFSGTGSVALEALSRGINSATLIDKKQQHLNISKKNALTINQDNIQYLLLDLSQPLPKTTKQFNFIYIDPPYLKNLISIAIKNLTNANWIAPQALIVVEHHKNETLEIDTDIFQILQQKKYKDTVFSFITNYKN
jgi:16S rRNA (guanine966-N2)-methyltransferase